MAVIDEEPMAGPPLKMVQVFINDPLSFKN